MGSSRLPGKVLLPLGDMPVIEHVVRRAAQIIGIDRIVIATTTNPEDDVLSDWADENSIDCSRGPVRDVVTRFLEATSMWGGTAVARITADCPLLDPGICSSVVAKFVDGDLDFCSNYVPPTFPDGLDFSVFRTQALEERHRAGLNRYDREHVTTVFERNTNDIKWGNVASDVDESSLRWTLDNFEDYEFLGALSAAAGGALASMEYRHLLELVKQTPHLMELQSDMPRNYGHNNLT